MRPYPLTCEDLVDDARADLDALTDRVRQTFGALSHEQLSWQPDEERWGVGQCLVHVARINQLYRERLHPALAEARARGAWARRPLRGSWFGRWFAGAVGPEARRRVETPPLLRPRRELVEGAALETFLAEQARLRGLLDRAEGIDLDRVKVGSPVAPLLRFRACDVFRILLAHEERHLQQAERVLAEPGFPA